MRDDDAALDIVQDAMMRLADRYADRPVEELPLVFQRIVQNAIRDYFRRSKVRSAVMTPLSNLAGPDADEDFDPLETFQSDDVSKHPEGPEVLLGRQQMLAVLEKEISALPARQREAFLLRYWEELDVAETAAVMGCSEGSVKTHCSRAAHALAEALKARGIGL